MKIEGSIELSGIKYVVFYKTNKFIRMVSRTTGSYYWYDRRRNRYLPHDAMIGVIKSACSNPMRRVWSEGYSINIERVGTHTSEPIKIIRLMEVPVVQ